MRTLPGGPPRLLVAKPGLDGHSNGAEQIAVAARDAGMEVIYSGIRLTGEQIAASARDEDVDVVGLSILSGSHLDLVPDVIARLAGVGVDAPVVVGGIIPEEDRPRLLDAGVAAGVHAERTSISRASCARSPSWPRPSQHGGRRLRAARLLATALWASLAGCGDDGNQSATTAAPSSSEATAPVGFELEDVSSPAPTASNTTSPCGSPTPPRNAAAG